MKRILLASEDVGFCQDLWSRMDKENYDLICVNKLEAAILNIKDASIDLVISNFINEERDEVLMEYLKTQYPRIIRLCFSNNSGRQDFYMPNDRNSAQLKIKKNIKIEEILSIIDKILRIDARVNNKDLLNLVSKLENLPTTPKLYQDLSFMITENASVERIAQKLDEDPSITANILKMANTAFYNAKTGDTRQAIMYIGLNNVKNIILSNSVFSNQVLSENMRDLHWRHVSMTNKILNSLYVEVLKKKLNNNIASVGLLHDIGTVVIMMNFPKIFNQITHEIQEASSDKFSNLEKKYLGFTHEEVGSHLLDLWGLPYPIIEAALFHQDPLNKDVLNKELVAAMHIAHYYAWEVIGSNYHHNVMSPEVFEYLGIPEATFSQFFEEFIENESKT